jgi:hypothetical protein
MITHGPEVFLLTPAVLLDSHPLRSHIHRLEVNTLGALDGRLRHQLGVFHMIKDTHRIPDTGKREPNRELLDILLELGNELGGLSIARLVGIDKVLEELAASLLLSEQRDLDDTVQELGDLLDIRLDHGSGGQSRGTDTDTTGDERRRCVVSEHARTNDTRQRTVTGNGVLVEGDVSGVTDLLDLGTGQTKRAEIPEDQVVLCTVGLQLVTVLEEDLGHGIGVGADLLGVGLEGRVGSLLEGDGDTGNGLDGQLSPHGRFIKCSRCCEVHPGKRGRRRR